MVFEDKHNNAINNLLPYLVIPYKHPLKYWHPKEKKKKRMKTNNLFYFFIEKKIEGEI